MKFRYKSPDTRIWVPGGGYSFFEAPDTARSTANLRAWWEERNAAIDQQDRLNGTYASIGSIALQEGPAIEPQA